MLIFRFVLPLSQKVQTVVPLIARYQRPVGKDGDTVPMTTMRAEKRTVLLKELQPVFFFFSLSLLSA